MSEYIIPIKIALLSFPFVAMLFTLPFLIYQYRKHGYINIFRAAVLYSFLLYLISAYYLVILPLPKTTDVLSLQRAGTKYTQLIPFNFIADILKETKVDISKPLTYLHLFRERAFLQVAFNGILLLPIGAYLHYYFKRNLRQTILIAFCVSLFFELTQLSGLYGIYNRPYRIFDVDDLIMNTFGGFLGYILSAILMKVLPNVSKLDEKVKLEDITVGFIRRSLALGFDWSIFIIIALITRGYFKAYMFVFIYFILIVYFTNGKTFGKWLLRIKVVGKEERLKFREVLVRYGVLYYAFFGSNYLIFSCTRIDKIADNLIFYLLIFILFLLDLAACFHVTIHFFSKNKKLLHDKLSGTILKVIK
ncbi:VanZ family protein [Clostridium oryzae]|uniref:VanZ like family protein n=1 Tax=Clostridium oryzae TaxID=1450648 RepID=A0A1V4IDI6_9CLOT|nr:VanZ family protein [Clostridium oryzae]OPJ58013.1 VanZ like family protein [Clostridium oryzae]